MKKNKYGFTFIEILVSLVIIGSLIGIMHVMINHLNIYSREERLVRASLLARELILSDKISEGEGVLDEPYKGFIFKKRLRETKYPGIYLYTVVVETEDETVVMDRFVSR